MRLNVGLIFALVCSSSIFAASTEPQKSATEEALHMNWLNTNISPSQDFYSYANGNWQKNNPIPPDYSSWGSFNIISEKVQNIIHQMLINAAKDTTAKPGSIEQKVGDFYYSGMDEESINQLGIKPLQPEFDRINNLKNLTDLQNEIAHLHQIGVDAFFDFGSMQDFKNSSEMIGALVQGGLGLPDRDYYLKDNIKFKQIRDAYVDHIAKMFELLGDAPDKATIEAKTVMKLETQMAKVSMSQVQQRDPNEIYHIMNLAQLAQLTPNFSWPAYFAAMGQDKLKHVNMAMPVFFKDLNKQLTTISLEDWKTYLRWHLIDSFASYLSKPFVDQNFKMVSVLTGAEKILPRWKRVVATENAALGFAIGKMYVDKYFSPEDKKQALDILKNIRTVLKEDINTLSWMTPATRKAALKKLDLMEERVGYPSKWWDYSKLKVNRGPYVLNVIRANKFLTNRDLHKIGKPIDKTEWAMTPQTINAYYDPSMNNLNIPAGILQSPFFSPDAPAAVNYGAIGFVMGHEMTHGFDDQGAKFDGYGNLKNWWTPSDLAKFQAATQCIVNQYSNYVVDDLHVQGKLVVGEATADLGGIILAYRAFQHSKEYKNAPTIAGMTPDQQFFLATAHVWAMNIRPQQIRNQITTDPHPPAQYRVNGSLANIPQFQAAYHLSNDSPMVNKNRCVIW
ncbi:M13 family metallopeptidase [Legionella longbeachae]|uniref:Metallopeptidase PepO, peptidase, M13 family n=1 Tax=Legionella longbeachae serogroup 1 (strain NSW150) TaxID=661367 RepID=D3HL61_LEGLN|nr:M13 family metallopeptidase [Legionella longbeachae]VEE03687.1 metallopeptidase PepO, peptidase, M13 family [Legionella oakridgensis]HBD7397508.1 M13 family metallopeptidase [Legionella pneumophila]ARB93431.1 M13 family peptidase [Legionella longbeachae]ARM33464.1 M13 family metallopeptidase [Legionella longbeachae]EEZ93685.1 putative endothelin-converting enzyme 1 [Legionella longbeachae D-4968]